MMYKIEKLDKDQVCEISTLLDRSQLIYHEYSFLNNIQLSNYFSNRVLNLLDNKDSIGYVLYDGLDYLGMIICAKNLFDSKIFGFGCYRITDLHVVDTSLNKTQLIIDKLISEIENELCTNENPFHLIYGLNNNTRNQDYIFNLLIKNQFYYIHTLLAFYNEKKSIEISEFSPKENLLIRKAKKGDAEQIANLAEKSFKYSRFHLDPYLDNTKACELLKISATNSIINEFVDVMFVAELNDKVVGYYSAKKTYIVEFDKIIGDAVIAAVDVNFRGLGIFKKLDTNLINWFSKHCDFAEMGTYLVNYPVHKVWINKGLGLIRGTHQFSKFVKQ